MHKTLGCMVAVLCATTACVQADPFRMASDWEWGGRLLVTPKPLRPNTPDPALKLPPGIDTSRILYTAISVGSDAAGKRINVILVQREGRPPRLYVDADNDQAITEAEGVDLEKDAVDFAPCRGRLSALVHVAVDGKPSGEKKLPLRECVVWQGSIPGLLFYAFKGYLQGTVSIDGQQRDAVVMDGDSNGCFHDPNADQLWIDLNGDGRLDVLMEQFAVRSVLRIGEINYNLVVSPRPDESRLVPIEGGMGKARVVLPGLTGKLVSISITLAGYAGEVVAARKIDQEFELPVGEYHISAMSAQVDDTCGQRWTYAFSHSSVPKTQADYPVKVTKDTTAEIRPADGLTVKADIQGDVKPGKGITVKLAICTSAGLELTETRIGGTRRYDSQAAFVELRLIDPSARPVATATSGFA